MLCFHIFIHGQADDRWEKNATNTSMFQNASQIVLGGKLKKSVPCSAKLQDGCLRKEKNEETRIRKNEERLRNLLDILKRSNILIIGVPEGEEEDQEIENLFESITKENFPDLANEINFQEVDNAQDSPKEVGSKEEHTKAHHNYITQD